ncbi:hypothetical protein GCM10025882_24250 [Acinetobacter gyllenbergii]|uniref:Immunity protein 35 domain-containing protein n=1 Tax=Acinetobacter gyllenbergii CIP 110306 = MTCC 11365 TaxID=1217657 RepID=A0A829HBN1_9GAMM|nr:hypothetical protein [Acinetobacter gyllenbergii]EPF73033.1 hypothetical protein F957_03642 [Acinetobacter gyllenbergii CIP 110306 = MTCC 11365]EPH35435.1 hypothetical protein L293_0026 [Acinetobacter gyllenbergii CIP 110306 = MTCC 11365]GMA12000.1 hypothetical protein GCM10025882_24250 [Acinetobacter gyllenbergii]
MKNISLDTAKEIIETKLTKISKESGEKCVIASIHELKDDRWIFGYNTEAFIKYNKISHCLAGNIPFFVSKTGELRHLTNDEYNSFLKKEN